MIIVERAIPTQRDLADHLAGHRGRIIAEVLTGSVGLQLHLAIPHRSRANERWADRVHPHVVAGQVEGRRLGKANDGALRCAVGGHVGSASNTSHRGRVHNGTGQASTDNGVARGL